MNTSVFNAQQTLEVLENKTVCVMISRPLLVVKKDEKILIQSGGYTALISVDDFLELFAMESFSIYKDRSEIDGQKDEEYYAWRALKQ